MLRRLDFRYAILIAPIFAMTNGINVRLQQSFTPPTQNPEKRMSGKADWWKHAVFYEIYPRSFYDSNSDGK